MHDIAAKYGKISHFQNSLLSQFTRSKGLIIENVLSNMNMWVFFIYIMRSCYDRQRRATNWAERDVLERVAGPGFLLVVEARKNEGEVEKNEGRLIP